MADYIDLALALKGYYEQTGQLDKWSQIATYGFTPQNIELLKEVPGMKFYYNDNGGVLGWDYSANLPGAQNPLVPIDSNLQTGTYGSTSVTTGIPGNMELDQTTGNFAMSSGLKNLLGTQVSTLGGTAFLATAGVSIATKLGKVVDSAIYSLAPDWWDEHFPSINPETWKDITTDNDLGSSVFRAVFGLNDDNSTTMYLDEKALAYSYAMMLENGFWSSGGYEPGEAPISGQQFSNSDITFMTLESWANTFGIPHNPDGYYYTRMKGNTGILCNYADGYPTLLIPKTYNNPTSVVITSQEPYTSDQIYQDGGVHITPSITITPSSLNQVSRYKYDPSTNDIYGATGKTSFSSLTNQYSDSISPLVNLQQITPIAGISDNPEAGYQIVPSTVINQTTGLPVTPQDDIDDIITALRLAYPQLFDGEIYDDVVQPDGSIDRHYYVPTPYPDMEDPTKPVTDTTEGIDPQTNPEYNPETRPEGQTQGLTDSLTESPTTPDTGSGTTPPFLPPDGTANALYAIYNPSQGELNSFGAWLWSSNFVDQLLKLFNDPMQAIIGLHKVFVNPVISGRQNIKVGYLDSGVASNVVGAQYVTVDCGSVTIPEYFGNVFDYDPFTQIYLYLPFVGIQRLDTGDVMRGTLNVVYHCDVLTGACLVEVNVFRDGGGGIIYTYTGNCAVQYPISSGSYMGIIASLASVVGGVVGTIATGGALAPVALGAVSGVMNAHTRVEHSGGFSGNAGAMGIKKPYVIITRPQTCLADNFPAFNGYPANKLTYIGDCTGYIKCDECHVEQVPGTDAELSELENLLKSGIII